MPPKIEIQQKERRIDHGKGQSGVLVGVPVVADQHAAHVGNVQRITSGGPVGMGLSSAKTSVPSLQSEHSSSVTLLAKNAHRRFWGFGGQGVFAHDLDAVQPHHRFMLGPSKPVAPMSALRSTMTVSGWHRSTTAAESVCGGFCPKTAGDDQSERSASLATASFNWANTSSSSFTYRSVFVVFHHPHEWPPTDSIWVAADKRMSEAGKPCDLRWRWLAVRRRRSP